MFTLLCFLPVSIYDSSALYKHNKKINVFNWIMLRWHFSIWRGLEHKFLPPPYLAATPCASLWESGSFSCPGKSFNWLRVPCGSVALQPKACLPTCMRVCPLHTLCCTNGMNLLWPGLIWHCQHVASSRLLQSVTRAPNMELHNL